MMRAPLILGAALLLFALLRRRAAAAGSLVALERPGGGRITDKRDPAPADVELVDGVPVHRAAAAAWRAMRAAYQADTGDAVRLRILSGYRSSARQAELFRRAVAQYGSEAAARRWVAPPGSSAHQSGRALDLDIDGGSLSSRRVDAMRAAAAWQWLDVNARAFGFYPYSAEPWHWEYNPPASPQAAPVGD
jgi:LAS superfamily LD-carboxypeptidase LdcB